MAEINPYASPRELEQTEPLLLAEVVTEVSPVGVWRDGRYLVMHKRARLPSRCVKCNRPATRQLRQRMGWNHPLVYLFLLAGPLIYVLMAIHLRQRATIELGLSDEWSARRKRRVALGWSVCLGGCLLFLATGVFAEHLFNPLLPAGLSLLVAIGGATYGDWASRMVSPARITKEYVWLKGVHPDFLESLPPWPGNV